MELIYETLEEACTSSPEYAGRLFHTVHNILTIYSHVVPTAHAHQLATLPQQAGTDLKIHISFLYTDSLRISCCAFPSHKYWIVSCSDAPFIIISQFSICSLLQHSVSLILPAIVHNNGMYLAHHALFLGHQYRLRLPQALRIATITTIDHSHELRKMSSYIFLKSMQNHRTALITTLRESVCECSSCFLPAVKYQRLILTKDPKCVDLLWWISGVQIHLNLLKLVLYFSHYLNSSTR